MMRRELANREAAVAIGRFVSDLDKGDRLGPVGYTMSRFVAREYYAADSRLLVEYKDTVTLVDRARAEARR